MADPSDLFHHPHHFSLFSDSGSEPDSEDPDFLALGLGLGTGLGLGFPNQEEDWTSATDADDFFVGRRGLVEIPGSDTDDEEQIAAIRPDPVPSLCWDCLRIDDEFEWEEVDDPRAAVVFENPIEIQEPDDELEEELAAASNWEFLLTMHAFGNPPEESYFVEDHDHGHGHGHDGALAYTSEYDEVLFDQFQEQEGAAKGGPPAARSVVEALPTVTLKEEVAVVGEGSPANCAVCKDEISADEGVKKLPCCHYYHQECILPWLAMRNTCPLCRHELLTDDVEYESRKARRASVASMAEEEEEVRVRYDFEMLPQALDE
ncbi:E3 ubiquitin-protein ligase CIP8-like [Iris pallida]|uniref:RING-type E3 ubiquitin transferase n=1 Tax=Iris pallida TaxID=29817 RepID=A0AAX6ESE0_IRIPA|nr:E3 ubiquitin-protein ligase CIP8-like [Iris pallida]